MGKAGRRRMGRVENIWEKQKIEDNMQKFHYFKRKMNSKASEDKKTYFAHIFIAFENSKKNLDLDWEYINEYVAVHYQSKTEALIERSNFYICFFVGENVDIKLKEEIEGNTFCAKKYIFDNINCNADIAQAIYAVEKRIFIISQDEINIDSNANISLNTDDKSPVYVESISLENFRYYAGKKELSFLTSGNRTAVLVVIYAKNGMGKTSIFDGVEFALKGQVDRIKEMVKRDIKDNKWKGAIYHNREHAKENSSVCIKLDNGTEVVRNVVSVANDRDDCRAVPAIKGNKIVGDDRELWNQLILPHYKIDNFVSARKPTDQYEEWSASTASLKREQEEFISSHKILVKKEKEKNDLEKNIEQKRGDLEKLENKRGQILEFQALISYYNKVSEDKLPEFCEENSPERYDQLKNKAANYAYIYKEKRKENKEEIEKIEYIFEVGYKVCVENKSNAEMLEREIGKLELEIQRIQERELLLEQEKNIKKQLETLQPEIVLYKKIKIYGTDKTLKKLDIYKNLIEKEQAYNNALNRLKEQKKIVEQHQSELMQRIESINKKKKCYPVVKEYFKNIKEILVAYSEEIIKLEEHSKKILELSEKKEKCQYQLKQLDKIKLPLSISEWDNKIQLEMQQNIGDPWYSQVMDIRNHYIQIQERIADRQKVLEDQKCKEKKLELALAEARKYIVDHQEICECPLCHTQFETWNSLMQKIFEFQKEDSESLDLEMKSLSEEIKTTENQYNLVYQEVNNVLNQRIKEYCNTILIYERELINIQITLDTCSSKQKQLKEQQQIWENHLLEYDIKLTNYEEKELIEWYEKLVDELNEVVKKHEELKNQEIKLKATADQYKEKLKVFGNEKAQIEKEPELFGYVQNLLTKPSDFEPEKYLEELIAEEVKLNQSSYELKKKLKTYFDVSQLAVSKLKAVCSSKKEALKSGEVLRKKFAAFASYSEEALQEKLNTAKKMDEKYANQQNILQRIKEENGAREYFKKINEYMNDLNEAQMKLVIQEKEIEQQREKFKKAKTILEAGLKAYFDQQLINEIYKKINPHEIMREMKYELSFNDNEEPQLIIKTSSEQGDSYRPEGYFSTAQLNAVAFSSFLGRALKSKKMALQSIFIDDPVGHFDDINILGFADLIRSILELTDYQIIMSTHDEKVFRILQRKLNQDYYPAKFIRLEEGDE